MPIVKRNNGWYYGSKGPFPTRAKAAEVGRAIEANKHSPGNKTTTKKRKK